jgi:hypothetical protein
MNRVPAAWKALSVPEWLHSARVRPNTRQAITNVPDKGTPVAHPVTGSRHGSALALVPVGKPGYQIMSLAEDNRPRSWWKPRAHDANETPQNRPEPERGVTALRTPGENRAVG